MIFAFDIGGTKMELVVFNEGFEPQMRERISTPTGSYDAFLDSIIMLVRLAEQSYSTSCPIGFGLPGLVDREGRSLCSNVPCASGQFMRRDLEQRLGQRVVIENDCRTFALSEAVGGAGTGCDTVFGAILGTGAAAGYVIGGQLQLGWQNIAGEFGHVPLSASVRTDHDLPLWVCGCGLPCCYESYVSGPGMMRLARHYGSNANSPAMLAQKWLAGDPLVNRIMDCYIDVLGACFASVVMLLDPQVIVLGGGLSRIDGLYGPLPSAIERHLFKGFTAPPVVPARFGDSSGVRGAAIMAKSAGEEKA